MECGIVGLLGLFVVLFWGCNVVVVVFVRRFRKMWG